MRKGEVDLRKVTRRRPHRGPLRIALAVPHSQPFVERVMGGVIEYARERGWTFARIAEARVHSTLWLRDWTGDGAIVCVTDRAEDEALRALPFPVVNLSGSVAHLRVPSVMVDHRAIGRLAVEHLAARRFTRFAYVGVSRLWYSAERREGFREAVARLGGTGAVHESPVPRTAAVGWREEQGRLDDWLKGLRPPVGILACSDLRAAMVLDACARLGLPVPEAVAVLGVDDAVLTCESCVPPLSSVSRSDRAVGIAAAALLERLVAGEAAPEEPVLVPPDGVTVRASTDTRAIEDPLVQEAVRWIGQHLHEPFGVDDLVRHTGRSRRSVEGLFRESLGCSPYAAICQGRIDHARRLLAAPGRATLKSIAGACGFSDARRFRRVFRRMTGTSPGAYRATLKRSLGRRPPGTGE